MIKHIVLFKLKSFDCPADKEKIMNDFKQAIEQLVGKIEGIVSLEVGLNSNPVEDYDIALVSSFATMDDLNFYAKHPLHVAAGAILKDAKESRACVDYIC